MSAYNQPHHSDLRALRDEIRASLRAGYATQLSETQLETLDQASSFVDRANIILRRSEPSALELSEAKDLLRIAQEAY